LTEVTHLLGNFDNSTHHLHTVVDASFITSATIKILFRQTVLNV